MARPCAPANFAPLSSALTSIGVPFSSRAQLAEAVEVLERQARRIAASVAGGAARVLHVIEQPAAHRALVLSCTLEKSTSAGGSGVGSHMKISCSLMPRLVGDDVPG